MNYLKAVPKPTPKAKAPPAGLRRSWLKRKRSRRVAKQTAEDRRYLDWVRSQPCAGIGFVYGKSIHGACHPAFSLKGRIEAAHFRDHTGMSLKEPDATCIPLCKFMHDAYDGRAFTGLVFGHMTFEERKQWHREKQLEVRSRYTGEGRG